MATNTTVVWIYFIMVSACLIQKGGFKKNLKFYCSDTKLMNLNYTQIRLHFYNSNFTWHIAWGQID